MNLEEFHHRVRAAREVRRAKVAAGVERARSKLEYTTLATALA